MIIIVTMITHNNINKIENNAKGCVLLIGNFDGLHLGHRAIIKEARNIADKIKASLAVMTFIPHPREFFDKDLEDFYLNSIHSKEKIFSDNLGIDNLFIIDFDEELSKISSKDFINKILKENLSIKHLIVGNNFTFGYRREGNIEDLKEESQCGSFDLTISKIKKTNNGEAYSSTIIRELLRAGKFDEAEKLLGRRWYIESPVVHGDKRGRELGFPTANQKIKKYVKIPYGIYAVKILIEGESLWREGVANFGIRPMFEVKTPVFETFIFDFDGDIYGQNILVAPIRHLRAEVNFENIETLVTQIKEDCINAKAVLKSINV